MRGRHVPPFKRGLQPLHQVQLLRRSPLCSTSSTPEVVLSFPASPPLVAHADLISLALSLALLFVVVVDVLLRVSRGPWVSPIGHTKCAHEAAHAHCGERRTEQPVAKQIGLWVAACRGWMGQRTTRIASPDSKSVVIQPRARGDAAPTECDCRGAGYTADGAQASHSRPRPRALTQRSFGTPKKKSTKPHGVKLSPARVGRDAQRPGGGEERRGGLTVP